MRKIIPIVILMIALPARAEIYKCKDAKDVYIYQQTPCQAKEVSKIRKDSGVSEDDRVRAQNRINAVFEREKQRKIQARIAEEERIKQAEEEEARELERKKVEYLKRQAIASERNAAANEKNAEATKEINKTLNQPVHCVPDNMGGMRCY